MNTIHSAMTIPTFLKKQPETKVIVEKGETRTGAKPRISNRPMDSGRARRHGW